MLKMRLQRIGRKNDPSFRVVVTDSRRGPKSGKHVDLIGSYNPKMDRVQIDGEKAKDWIAKGVQVSDTLHNLLVGQNIIEGKKVNVLPKKSPVVNEETEAPSAPAAADAADEQAGTEEGAEAEAKEESATTEEPTSEPAETEATPEQTEDVPAEAPVEAEEQPETAESPEDESKN